jgi:hypothetical protein
VKKIVGGMCAKRLGVKAGLKSESLLSPSCSQLFLVCLWDKSVVHCLGPNALDLRLLADDDFKLLMLIFALHDLAEGVLERVVQLDALSSSSEKPSV